jgi:hypothetical protein
MSIVISKTHRLNRVHFPYEFAIIARHSVDIFQKNTLSLLQQYHIPATKITIFLDASRKDEYKTQLAHGSIGKMVVVSKRYHVYNFISKFYEVGTPLIYMQDNVQELVMKNEEDGTLQPLNSLLYLLKRGFGLCGQHGARLWGVYPYANASFLKKEVSTGLKYIHPLLWGTINPGVSLQLKTNLCTDYERCLQYYKVDHALVRLNDISCVEQKIKVEKDYDEIKKEHDFLYQQYQPWVIVQHDKHNHSILSFAKDV